MQAVLHMVVKQRRIRCFEGVMHMHEVCMQKLAVVWPSSGLRENECQDAEDALHVFADMGWECTAYQPMLAGDIDDHVRVGSFIQGIEQGASLFVAARGGWGSARVLVRVDALLTSIPMLLGFSDVTTLLWAKARRQGQVCLHGPMLSTLCKEPTWSLNRLQRMLRGQSVDAMHGKPLVPGIVCGPLWVGNLCVASHLIGTPYMPDLRGGILLFEEISEPLYKIDRMLTFWEMAGLFDQVRGFAFGRMLTATKENDARWHAFIMQKLAHLQKPIMVDVAVGHGVGLGHGALPVGGMVRLDGDRGTLEVLSVASLGSRVIKDGDEEQENIMGEGKELVMR